MGKNPAFFWFRQSYSGALSAMRNGEVGFVIACSQGNDTVEEVLF